MMKQMTEELCEMDLEQISAGKDWLRQTFGRGRSFQNSDTNTGLLNNRIGGTRAGSGRSSSQGPYGPMGTFGQNKGGTGTIRDRPR